jgi:hypothetical protein
MRLQGADLLATVAKKLALRQESSGKEEGM